VSSARAPTSNSHGQWPYHGELIRARDVRGGDGARSEMEASAVSGGGRNGQLQRGACAGGGGGEHVRGLCCCWCGGRKWEAPGEADARAAGVSERGGAQGATGRPGAAVAGAWRPPGSGNLPQSGHWRAARGRGERAHEAGQAASAVGQKLEHVAH
jgi:hypothetical protein